MEQTQQEEQIDIQQTTNNDGFTKVSRTKNGKISVTSQLSLANFYKLFSNKTITYYDKRGKKHEFDNEGIIKKYIEQVKDKSGKVITDEKGNVRLKYTVHVKTYISLMDDIVMISWDNNEVSFYTKLNHHQLNNWGGKMYWKTE
jgi:hypothetical protein